MTTVDMTKTEIKSIHVLVVMSGYVSMLLVAVSAFIPLDQEYSVFVGILPEPWMEWGILSLFLFLIDFLVVSRLKSKSEA